jgi:hypothetical protein
MLAVRIFSYHRVAKTKKEVKQINEVTGLSLFFQ